MNHETRTLAFASDYQCGACPEILHRIAEDSSKPCSGYGTDEICERARVNIRAALECPADPPVYFLVGGTQTNATVIDAVLKSYQGVLCAETGHIAQHEAGAIELGGHKVLALPHEWGKISADTVQSACENCFGDENHDHMVMPGMVYISQPTEYGTLYSLAELQALHEVCERYHLPLYVDGARLAYALGSEENDVSLSDLANLCDVFYIGGTKCGALFGEAVVFPNEGLADHFFTIVKQHGALLAKGFLLGMQFDTLFTDDLYLRLGQTGMGYAKQLRSALLELGIAEAIPSQTNQIFIRVNNEVYHRLVEVVPNCFWEADGPDSTVVRFVTSWATRQEDVDALIDWLRRELAHAAS